MRAWTSVFLAALCIAAACGDQPDSGPDGVAELIRDGEFQLSEAKREYIWTTEHQALVLGQDLLPVIRRAIRDGEAEALARFLSRDFVGRPPAGPGVETQRGAVSVRDWNDPGDAVSAHAFLAWLVGAQPFEAVAAVGFHFTTLRPEKAGDLSGRWRAVVDVHVLGRPRGGGRAERMLRCEFAFKSLSDDIAQKSGWIDAISVTRVWQVATPAALMEEITPRSGIDTDALADNWKREEPPFFPVTGRAHLFDYDQDGRSDLLITDQNGLFLYRGEAAGGFRESTSQAGLRLDEDAVIVGSGVADLDGDGLEDLVMCVEYMLTRKPRCYVYANKGDGTFRRLPPDEHNLNSFGIRALEWAIADYDGDGLVDIYVPKQGAPSPQPLKDARWLGDRTSAEGLLLRNRGGWRFDDATARAEVTGENVDTFGAIWFDYEPDGDPDLFLCNHLGANVLWLNDGDGTFTKRALDEGFGGLGMGVTAGDLDGDGDEDLYLANMYSSAGSRVMGNLEASDYPPGIFPYIQGLIAGNELYDNRGAGGMKLIGVKAGVDVGLWAYGPAMVDLDGDGRLDIYSPAGFQSVTRGKPDG